MAEVVLYMGNSGVGKTSSLRNLDSKETLIISPNGKSLPFPGGDTNYTLENKNLVRTNELDSLARIIANISNKAHHIKRIIVDDYTHFFSARIFSPSFINANSGNAAFAKWNVFGASVYQSIFAEAQNWREDLTIVIIHHTEMKEDGIVGAKTPGKLLDNAIDFPSYFTYIFHGVIHDGESGREYLMQTNSDGVRHAKTPYGVFDDLFVPNDLAVVLDRIEAYRKGDVEVEWLD